MNVYENTFRTKNKILMILFSFGGCLSNAQNEGFTISQLPIMVPAQTRKLISQQLDSKIQKQFQFNDEEKKVLVADLSALYELKGEGNTSPLYQQIFSQNQLDGKGLVAWLFKSFQYIAPSQGRPCGLNKEKEYIGCYSPLEKTIKITPSFFKRQRIHRLSVLIHEARHAQGYYHSRSKTSLDDTIDAARGAQLSFFKAVMLNCSNCLFADKVSAFSDLNETAKELENLNSHDQTVYAAEFGALKDPYDQKYNSLIAQLKVEGEIISAVPYICLNKIPYNEFKGEAVQALIEDCILLYHYVPTKEVSANPELLKRKYQQRDGFLLIFIPVEKK